MKESIIVGRLIPAGTGFITRKLKQDAQALYKDGLSESEVLEIDSL